MVKKWKIIEQRVTDYLPEAERMSLPGMGGPVEDIQWKGYSIEVKTRADMPEYIVKWWDQAKRNSEGKVPVVVWHRDYTRIGNQFVIMELQEFKRLVLAVERSEQDG